MSGKRFGKLVVIEPTKKRYHGSVVFLCRCDCGNYKEVPATSLSNNGTKSCGCLVTEENKSRIGKPNLKNAVDLTGKKAGTWTALKRTNQKIGSEYY